MRFIWSKLSRKYSLAAARARAELLISGAVVSALERVLYPIPPLTEVLLMPTHLRIFFQIYASCSMGDWADGRSSGRRQDVSYYSRPVTASFPLRHFASARKSIWSEGFSSFRLRLTWFHVAFRTSLPDRFRLQRVYAGPGLIGVVRDLCVEQNVLITMALSRPCPCPCPCPVTAYA